MIYLNNLGTFDTIQQVWEAYPYGGKEGDFVVVDGARIGWDKYAQSWEGQGCSHSSSTQPSPNIPEVTPTPSAPYEPSLFINNLGEYPSVEDVWKAYPHGGKEGDYVIVAGEKIGWNKYSLNWGDNSLSASAGNQQDNIIPDVEQGDITSYTITNFLNNLGEFDAIQDVWSEYPYGGKEGDYVTIGGVKIGWNKYTKNWGDDKGGASAGNQPEIVPPSAEPSEPTSTTITTLYNFRGEYPSVLDAWKAMPLGGKEGDYIIIDGNKIGWNKYTSNWGDNTEDANTPELSKVFYGDVHIKGDAIIEGEIIAEGLYDNLPIDNDTLVWKKGMLIADIGKYLASNNYIQQKDLSSYVQTSSLTQILGKYAKLSDLPIMEVYATREWVLQLILESGGGNNEGGLPIGEFVTLATTQTITGLKTFTKGVKIGDIALNKLDDGVVYIDGNLVVKGSLTMYGDNDSTVSSIFEGIPIDWETIKWKNGVLVAEVQQGGIDTKELDSILATKNYITLVDVKKELVDYAKLTAIPSLDGFAMESWVSKNFLSLNGGQVNGDLGVNGILSVNGANIVYNADKGYWQLKGDLLVDGAISQYANGEGYITPTIMDAIVVDEATISKEGGALHFVGKVGGIDTEELNNILATKGYITINNVRQELVGYAKLTDIPSLDGFADRNWVSENYLPIDGIAESAKKLANKVTIWGHEFNGTEGIDGTLTMNGGQLSYDPNNGYWIINGDLLVTGAVTQYGSATSFVPSTIMDAIIVDDKTISKDGGKLHIIGGTSGGGIDESQLEDYLKREGYATNVYVRTQLMPYITADTIASLYALKGEIPTDNNQLSNGAGYITISALKDYALKDDLPKNLSDLKDDILQGYYLSLKGGTIEGNLGINGDLTLNGGLVSYNSAKRYWQFNGDVLVSGAITQFANGAGYDPSTIMDAIQVDGVTIKKVSGRLVAIGGGGGGSADGLTLEQLEGYLDAYNYVTSSDVSTSLLPYAKLEALNNYAQKATTLSGYGITNAYTKDEVDTSVGKKADTTTKISAGAGLTGGGDLSKNRTISLAEVEGVNGTYTKVYVDKYGRVTQGYKLSASDIPELSWGKITSDKPTTLEGYGITDSYTKKQIDTEFEKYVKLATAQDITAMHNFANGLKIGGVSIYKSADGVVYIDGNLVLSGGVTMYGADGTPSASLFDALPIDGKTIKWVGGLLTAVGGGQGGGITLDEVEDYLTEQKYAKIADVANSLTPYARMSDVSSLLSGYAPLSAIPTKLSQLTDDVVAGKYLPLTGGKLKSSTSAPLEIESTSATDVSLILRLNSQIKSSYGYNESNKFAYLQTNGHFLKLFEDGNVYVDSNKVITSSGGTLTGNLTAPKFIGALQGNADSATNATKLGGHSANSYIRHEIQIDTLPVDANKVAQNSIVHSYEWSNAAISVDIASLFDISYTDDWRSQLFLCHANGKMYWRRFYNGSTWSVWKTFAFTDSNVASATKLATPRKIWGQEFDGTKDIGVDTIGTMRYMYFSDGKGSHAGFVGRAADDSAIYLGAYGASPICLMTGNSTRMTVTSNGNVGIGTSSPSTKLDVNGNTNINGTLTLNSGLLSYDKSNGYWTLNGDLLVTGAVTQFAQGTRPASTIMDAIMVDGETITKRDGKLVALGNASGEATVVALDASLLAAGKTFYIAEAQLNAIKAARSGGAAIVKDVNNTNTDSEWGQVISCYRQYAGSSIYVYRVSILHKVEEPLSGSDNAKLYNIDIMDYQQSGGYYCTVTSVNNLY